MGDVMAVSRCVAASTATTLFVATTGAVSYSGSKKIHLWQNGMPKLLLKRHFSIRDMLENIHGDCEKMNTNGTEEPRTK